MRIYLFFLLAFILSACANQNQRQTHNSDDDYKKDLANEIMREKIDKNGTSVLCAQPGYRKCFGQSEISCLQELNQLHQSCINFADKKVGKLQIGVNNREYGKLYTICLAMKHISNHGDRVKEISACIKDSPFDKDLAVKELLK